MEPANLDGIFGNQTQRKFMTVWTYFLNNNNLYDAVGRYKSNSRPLELILNMKYLQNVYRPMPVTMEFQGHKIN